MRHLIFFFGLLLLPVGVPLLAESSVVTVRNTSDWVVMEFYMTPADVEEWGPDLLDEEVLGSGDSLTLYDISCDFWDLLFIDEDGDECILTDVALCNDNATWDITNDELLHCVSE